MADFSSKANPPQGTEDAEPPSFFEELHRQYILRISEQTDTFEFCMTEHLRMSGVYWGLMGMALMGRDLRKEMGAEDLASWVMRCQHEGGGFGGNEGHDPHILYTLSALQVMALLGELNRVDKDKVAGYVSGLQQSDGSFFGDEWGEVDTRFSYCALSSMAILGQLDSGKIDVKKAAEFVGRCRNFDGGFGCIPGAESHAGQIFTCVGALSIARSLHLVDEGLLGWWLCERQCDSGGLNGRPEKQADVCYSWWILSSLKILGKVDWIDGARLKGFILRCQDSEDGGIAERPGNLADIFHTFFGIAGLSLLGYFDGRKGYDSFLPVDAVYALPVSLVEQLGLKSEMREPRPLPHGAT
ncbi:unnamed protein product [Ectocarpus sp. 12 AP-2014]